MQAGAASPLHEAAWSGHADVVAEMLRHGAQHDAPSVVSPGGGGGGEGEGGGACWRSWGEEGKEVDRA